MKKKLVATMLLCMLLISCGSNRNENDTINDAVSNTSNNANGYYYDEEPAYDTGESYAEIVENKYIDTDINNTSTFSIDVDTASYANIRDLLSEGILPNKDAVRIEEMINYFDYTYKQPEGSEPFSLTTVTCDTPWNENTVVALIGIQGKDLPKEQVPPSNIVMLIDVSGSMQDSNKLPLLKKAMIELTNNLTEKDRISLVVYAGAAGVVLEGAEGNDKESITEALNNLEAGGSTAGGAGIELAYSIAKKYFIENGNNRVILASDGDFNVGMSDVEALKDFISEKREIGVFLSVLGFGRGNTRDDIMEGLADTGNGNYSYIDNISEARKVFGSEFTGTLFTIAKDVKIQVEFNTDFVRSYRLIGYENRVLENQDFTDDTKDAGELGYGHEVTALYEIELRDGTDKNKDKLYDIRFRYKEPNQEQSKEIVLSNEQSFISIDEDLNLKWALSVAEFGLILRDSDYKNQSDINRVLSQARNVLQLSYDEYKEGFIEVVKDYMNIQDN
ncbi:MAG: von Willebrand factor type A domain-containing protein [Clostridia bacterium]|nr:von Willebrand factor type A domain-containing protein [Clostridia bacterium]